MGRVRLVAPAALAAERKRCAVESDSRRCPRLDCAAPPLGEVTRKRGRCVAGSTL
jgi:hypothetical protein